MSDHHGTVLLRGGTVYSPADPFATAMIVQDGTVAWIGSEGAADGFADGVDRVVHLEGALVTPAFTDAHVHTTATGLALTGLDLAGAASLADALARVAEYAAAHPGDDVVLGHGWDAARWPENRPPSRAELDAATGGRPLYLTRVDVHSAVVTTALLDRVPGVASLPGFDPAGPLTRDAHHAVRRAAQAAAGDLFVDGSLGSHTACLRTPYADAGTTGVLHLDAGQVADHVAACTEAGLQAGFHAIGDAALDTVVAGVRAAAERVGLARIRAARHRVEHAEMLDADAVAAFADLGLTASVQPAFDAAWGGEEGMYAARLGNERARALNPFAALLRAGVPLALGSDAPVTPLDPWGTVRAAAFHRTAEHRVSVRAAFTAHTRGGWRALGRDEAGVLVPGAPADYALWNTAGDLVVQTPDDRIANWSTDPRSGTPGLPDLSPGTELPRCVRTVVGGRTVFASTDE